MLTEITTPFATPEGRAIFDEKMVGAKYPHYQQLLEVALETVHEVRAMSYGLPDPNRITQINHGDYQGTLVYVIAGGGYQPHDHFATHVFYGSCSGCDTLESINMNSDPAEKGEGYYTLALHMRPIRVPARTIRYSHTFGLGGMPAVYRQRPKMNVRRAELN